MQPTADGEFHRISAISKYVGFTSSVKNSIAQTYHESKSICEDADLEMAEVTSLVDHWSLSTHSASGSNKIMLNLCILLKLFIRKH